MTSTDRPATGDNPATEITLLQKSTTYERLHGTRNARCFSSGDTAEEGADLEYFFDIGGDTIFAGKTSQMLKKGV